MSRDLAIDFGSANTLVFARGRGIVLDQPTLIALNERTGEVVAMGEHAWSAAGRGGDAVVTFRPLRRGAVTDFELTQRLLHLVMRRVGVSRLVKPRVLVTVPSSITIVERRAVEEATLQAGARQVWLLDEAVAAALGAGLPIDEPTGNCVVDIGGGTTEVAVISMGGVVASRTAAVGGFDFDEALMRFMRRDHGVVIGERTAEALKIAVGSAGPLEEETKAEVHGRELSTGAPREVVITSEEIRAALDSPTRLVIDAVRATLADTPPDLAHDVLDHGIRLTGGGSLLRSLAERIARETAMSVHPVPEPLSSVCLGAARALESLGSLRDRGLLASTGPGGPGSGR